MGFWLSLPIMQKDDLKAAVEYLRADGNVPLIGLWGRSMGAVTSLIYGAEDPSIAGMVLDSPFSDLVDLMMELVDTWKVRLPKFTVAKSCFVPVLIGHAVDDDFIHPHHSNRIYESYEDEGKSDDHIPSSSNMMSFELSDGNPYGPCVPAIIEDDDYVEYALDSLSDFRSNIEEEEKMLMEAIMMSLKDQEMGHPEVEEPQSTVSNNTSESSPRVNRASSTTEQNGPVRDDSAAGAINDQSTVSNAPASNTSLSSKVPFVDSSPPVEEPGDARDLAENGVSTITKSSSAQGEFDADISSNTKAMLTVEQSPSGNITDGSRQWDFNFFRNRR